MKTLTVALASLALAASIAATPVVRYPQPLATGTTAIAGLNHGDFDGDGHDDVLLVDTTNEKSGLSALLDNGSGPFAAPHFTAVPIIGGQSAVGDINEDGHLDVVLSDTTIIPLLGNGDGTFTQGIAFGSSIWPTAVTLGDFNGDHHLDLAVEAKTYNSTQLATYFGDGTGSFSSGGLTDVTGSASTFTTADLNADGRADLIANDLSFTKFYVSNVDGTFTLKSWTDSGAVTTADFNHDGKLDAAVAFPGSHHWYIEIDFGNGDGSMTQGPKYLCAYEPASIAAADVDGDGTLDLVAGGQSLAVLRGNADGTFQSPKFFLGGVGPWKIAVSDFNRDGKLDVVFADGAQTTSRLAFAPGNGDGSFPTDRVFHTNTTVPVLWPGLSAAGGVAADVNNDQKIDVVFMQKHDGSTMDAGVMLNDGTGKLGAPILTTFPWSGGTFGVADVNGDGKLDVVTITSSARVLLGNGDGTFTAQTPFSLPEAGKPLLADFDGDQTPDLMYAASGIELHHGNGNGTFGSATYIGSGDFGRLVAGDVNNDGHPDFIRAYTLNIYLYLNDGAGHFTAKYVTSDSNNAIAFGDFDNDSKLDLVYLGYAGLYVRRGNGDGTFRNAIIEMVSPKPDDIQNSIVTADFDGDGNLDVAFGTNIYLGNGHGSFTSREQVRADVAASCSVGDMDGNGSPDLVTMVNSDDVQVILTRVAPEPTQTTTLSLAVDHNPAQYKQTVNLTATVTGGLTPLTGVVRFTVDGVPAALIAVDANGKATYTTTYAVGTHPITATYVGDGYYQSSGDATSLTVTRAVTQITIYGQPNPQSYGRNVAIYVIPPYGITGQITLRDGDTPLDFPQIDGSARNISTLSIGTHVITADYPGDANFAPASVSYEQVITKPEPTLSVTISPTPAIAGSPVTLHAYFIGQTNITGTVSFYEGDTLLGNATLVNGAGDFQTTFTWGYRTLQARYSGDATWGTATYTFNLNVYGGPWGTTPSIRATGSQSSVYLTWSQIVGATSYTVWYRQTYNDSWQVFATYSAGPVALSTSMTSNRTWQFAVTATNSSNNATSAMSPPDLATSVSYTDAAITAHATKVKAQQIAELRTAINCIRTFAGLGAYTYTNPATTGQPIRAADIRELRTALGHARANIGFPAITFTDADIVEGATRIRAAHVLELRAGVE